MSNKKVNMGTQAVWSGEKDVLVHGATQVPVVVSVAYNYDDMDEWYDVATGKNRDISTEEIRTRQYKPLKKK